MYLLVQDATPVIPDQLSIRLVHSMFMMFTASVWGGQNGTVMT